ncbi:type IV fimbrial biogenesis protein FimT [Stenotrophomonas rhizophila]|jgi:type IV fimbrial biogenesis protein FimT|uniref:Type II secretion system protein H n=2 Tax=Stenotrophomonas TaxID=40323 RepID=A0AAP5E9N9_9GAMM|nr:GspH/FimT family protein [Stenotrophomonas rhizophila]MDQ1109099.1 type IV fimbrial biogenesis protein FimT [Stenotrophomonas rhizophila]
MHRPRPFPRPRGFTLLELTVTLLILAVLCALALPSLSASVSRMRADMLRMQLVSVFNTARSTAITRAAPVAVCPSEDGMHCGDDWSRGWLIHLDRGSESGTSPPSPTDVLQYRPGYRDASVVARSSQNRPRLRLQPDGRSGGSPLTVAICAGGQLHGEVVVNNVGRTRAARRPGTVDCPH